MALDGSYMANEEENHALVVDDEVLTEFALMAKSSSSLENEVYDDSYCSKSCRKNTENLNTKISKLNEELSDCETDLYHYKRGLERDVKVRDNKIEYLMNELEQVKKEKEGLDNKLTGFESSSKDLDNLLGSLRSNKNEEGLGYNAVPLLLHKSIHILRKIYLGTSLPELVDDTVTDYSRATPSIDASKCNTSDLQSSNFSVSEHGESSRSIMSKPMIKFVKASNCLRVIKTNNSENARKSAVKYGEMYRNTSKSPKVRDSGCSRHMIGNISYLSEYEPYDGGYVSFGQGGGKVTGKGIIKTSKLEFENVYFVKELKYNLFSVSQICYNKNSVLFTDSECIVLGNDFKLKDDTNVFLGTPRQYNMYSIDLNNIIPHKNLTYLVAKASFDEKMNKFYTKKGIRREFSNGRTPQQNGVAERRNKTLIEATRTILADVKLPVTFWAEAVNTACYVQNRVLVNKSQNKTPYELFNSKIPAIGFLRPFRCHVMILNTLDHLRKFDAKGDEGYFVRYSLSGKAFRVFNKRTKNVEENMHVDFLENKLIEKEPGPNWLFDIDTLTISMNYVPVVVAGTSSTNILAYMETRNSDAPDGYNADDLESSGIFNPTATLKVPSADQVEPAVSLTVESEIPTISSRVPTICLDISPKSLSGPRLITKWYFSQKETPSLDNALMLSNKFEDTFGMEADLSNMETSIPASPTPTFRIHKDHPKRQIIGPVDTPVQTRHKFKEMEEQTARIEAIRLFLAYASFMGFIIYQMDVKSAFLYGIIDEKVYVMQPPRFQDPEFLDKVYKVEKAVYGLHQAPKAWYDEPASLLRDDRQGEAFPTVSSLDAGHDKENIAKTSALPHESSQRVTSLDADEGSMQQRIHELIDLCTSLQRQQSQMAVKIKDQDLEISGLKARVKSLEEKERRGVEPNQEDALITRGIMEIRDELGADKSTELGSNDTEEMVNVLSSIEAVSLKILSRTMESCVLPKDLAFCLAVLRPNGEALRKCIRSGPYKPTTVLVHAVEATDNSLVVAKHTTVETPANMSPENKAHFLAEKEAIHLILTGIGDDIYSTVDACQTAQEM
nr:ribonuclease H-like domain-containing protein [Tanacetum cinerariifolium]